MTQACWICDEGYNGEIPCPQCNTEAWNAYHEEHKQIVTVVERGTCGHERWPASVESRGHVYDGLYCPSCQDVVDITPVAYARAETVE